MNSLTISTAHQVIVVGGGVRKSAAILAALRSGLVSTLVTDDAVAPGSGPEAGDQS